MSVTQSVYQKKGTWKKKKTLVARVVTWGKIQEHIVKSQVSRWHIHHLPLLSIYPVNPLFQVLFVKKKILLFPMVRSKRNDRC